MTHAAELSVAVLGAGPVGRTVGRRWAAAGHRVAFGSRHPLRLAPFVDELGARARADTWVGAVRDADLVLLAVAHEGVPDVLAAVRDHLHDAVLVDATNPMGLDEYGRIVSTLQGGLTQGSWTAAQLPGTRVVRAFSHVMDEVLDSRGRTQPLFWGMGVAGDDADAVRLTERLVRDTGFEPVHVGTLAQSSALDPGGALFPHLFTPADLREQSGRPADGGRPTVRQLRLVVEAPDYEDAVRFYRDVLAMPELTAFSGDGDARVAILDAGRATLAIATTRHRST